MLEGIVVIVALHFELVVAIYFFEGHLGPALDILLSLVHTSLLFPRGLGAHARDFRLIATYLNCLSP